MSSDNTIQDRQPGSLSLLKSYHIPRASLASTGRERMRDRESARLQESNVTCKEAVQKVSECLNEVRKFKDEMQRKTSHAWLGPRRRCMTSGKNGTTVARIQRVTGDEGAMGPWPFYASSCLKQLTILFLTDVTRD